VGAREEEEEEEEEEEDTNPSCSLHTSLKHVRLKLN
jgi:hypothetical protein